MDSIFVSSMLNDKITIKPNMLSEDMQGLLEQTLRDKYEGVCSYHGYIKPDSIKVVKYSVGHVCAFSLNGDVMYRVMYQASVCNPVIGNIIRCNVVNMNKFGILAEATTTANSAKRTTVLDVIIPKNSPAIISEMDLESIKINDEIFVEIKGKKFELNDKKISIVGRVVLPANLPKSLRSASAQSESGEHSRSNGNEDADPDADADEEPIEDDTDAEETGSGDEDGESSADPDEDEEPVVVDSDEEDVPNPKRAGKVVVPGDDDQGSDGEGSDGNGSDGSDGDDFDDGDDDDTIG